MLIILHNIGKDGTLMEIYLATGQPIDDLKWKGDTYHSERRDDRQLADNKLWVEHSHMGNYHENMNSESSMLWVKHKLVFCGETIARENMVLVADNAPYHHKREIGSLLPSKW